MWCDRFILEARKRLRGFSTTKIKMKNKKDIAVLIIILLGCAIMEAVLL